MRLTGTYPPTRHAVNAALDILKSKPQGASTKEIFYAARSPNFLAVRRAAEKKVVVKNAEIHKGPPFPSVSYLKNTVLKRLQYKGRIEKFHVKKPTKKADSASAGKGKAPVAGDMKLAWLWRIKSTTPAAGVSSQAVDTPTAQKS